MNKLMGQLGKPYRWGGTSPRTGFDCSGLVYYAYKDLVKIHIPRTANEMYHLRDARPVDRDELQSGDLVFFRTRGRGAADHVGVYVGNGKFIQSPRTGRDIQITSLSEDYWVRHYVGARRVMTPKKPFADPGLPLRRQTASPARSPSPPARDIADCSLCPAYHDDSGSATCQSDGERSGRKRLVPRIPGTEKYSVSTPASALNRLSQSSSFVG
ncbi:lipoprotein [Klebsiella pneumoniae]|uniref:Lipoprotein n=1 Tax=Klebsiella pneumoniae TaxID=573 RepID=A0A378F3K4_KLEPN|nr:lipoprotein [Klebsiella pneumoniae]